MINLIKLISSLTLVIGLIFLNLQLDLETTDQSNIHSGYNMNVEVVDAGTCKTELGGVCEDWSELTTGECNVVKNDNQLSAYPCKE